MSGIPKTLEALVLLLVVLADPVPAPDRPSQPKIVASPTTAQPAPVLPVGAPVPLDAGKFVFLDVQGHTGPITWEFSKTGIVALLPDAPAAAVSSDYFPGIKQGESAPAWHKAPTKNSVPCVGVSGGTTIISAWGVLDGRAKKIAELTMQVGPAPPKVDPVPVDPVIPPVSTNPFGTTKGLHVMMTYRDNFPLPIGQHNAIYGGTVRNYLNAKCETPDSYRIWKTNTQTAGDDPKIWKDAFARKRTADEWIIIGNGTTGYEGPLPQTVEETMALLKKYEGK